MKAGPHVRTLLANVGIALAYFVAAQLGFAAFDAKQVTPVWPPAGIALAGILVLGARVWPGIAAGALLANLAAKPQLLPACGIMTGNTLEAVTGWLLLRRALGFRAAFSRPRDVAAFLAAAAVSPAVASTIGVASIHFLGGDSTESFGKLWAVWWLGDAMGILIVAPPILVWARRGWSFESRRLGEAIFFFGLLLLANQVFFAGKATNGIDSYPFEYIVFPFVVWAALRFGQRGVTLVILASASMAVLGTVNGYGPFGRASLLESLALLEIYLSVMAVTGLLLAASTTRRRMAERNIAAGYAITRLLSESTDLSESTPSIAQCVCEHLGWEGGALWKLCSDGKLRCSEFWSPPGEGLGEFEQQTLVAAFEPGVGLPGRVWASRQPVWIRDVTKDSNFPRAPWAARSGVRSALGFPVAVGSEMLGVMEFYSRDMKHPDDEVLRILATVGSQIGQLLDRQRREIETRRSEALKAAILEAAQDAIITVDHGGRIVEFNAAAERIFGCGREDALGTDLAARIAPPDQSDQMQRGLAECLSAGEGDRRIELTAMRAGGERFAVEVAVARIPGTDPPMFTGTLRDISERKLADAQRERLLESERVARSEAEKANRVKDDFLATLSHELRTPLQAILGWSALLREGGMQEDDWRKAIETIERNARIQTQIVEDLLDMSRILSGKTRLDVEEIDIADVIEESIKTVRPASEARGIAIERVYNVGARVRGDATRLQQVTWNLLSNAIKFTPSGGRITVTVTCDPQEAMVTVTDTGQGIPAEFLPHLFERFRQADASTTRLHGGLGLGLAIVKHIIELHGGRIEAGSAGIGKGSTFRFTLPLSHEAPEDGDEPRVGDARGATKGKGSPGSCNLRGVIVLVVDDREDARAVVQRMLERSGAEVLTARSGEEALRLLEEGKPTVLVSDIAMPGMDGYQLIKAVREGPESRRMIPAVALSAFGRLEDRLRALSAGYQMHVSKPVDPAELVGVVAVLAGLRT